MPKEGGTRLKKRIKNWLIKKLGGYTLPPEVVTFSAVEYFNTADVLTTPEYMSCVKSTLLRTIARKLNEEYAAMFSVRRRDSHIMIEARVQAVMPTFFDHARCEAAFENVKATNFQAYKKAK